MTRHFRNISTAAGLGYQTECRECGAMVMVTSNKHHALPDAVVIKKFQAKGWHVGSKEGRDLCPQHAHRERKANGSYADDAEGRLITRAAIAMQQLGDALDEYAALSGVKRGDELMARLEEFHTRVFGSET